MTDKITRTQKTPRQRAQEALAVAERKVKRLETEKAKHDAALTDVSNQLGAARKRRDYLAQDPDLPQQPVQRTRTPGATTGTTPETTP